jgi:hypothetical protein
MATQYANSVDAAQAALDAHDSALKLETGAEPGVQLWHLLYSLHDWCNEHDIDLEKELKIAHADWWAASTAA